MSIIIVEYNDGTFKYQSRPKFNSTPKYIKFKHDYNILELTYAYLNMVRVHNLINQQRKLMKRIKKEQKFIQAQNLVREFEYIWSVHRSTKGSQLSFV